MWRSSARHEAGDAHRFGIDEMFEAYGVFAKPGATGALKLGFC